MKLILVDAFSVTQYITHPISLVAYISAAIMVYFINRDINERKKIEAAPESERANIIIKTAERLHLDLTLVPKNERADLIRQVLRNRIYKQLIIAFIILVIGMLASYFVLNLMKIKNADATTKRKETALDLAEKQKVQNKYSIKGITLEGETLSLMADSAKLSKDWVDWFDEKPIILTAITGTLDTLKKFSKQFAYLRDISEDTEMTEEDTELSIIKNAKHVKSVRNSIWKSIYASDPNASVEYSFTTNFKNANARLGFDKECFLGVVETSDTSYTEYLPCELSLSQKGFNWLVRNYKLETGLGPDEEEGMMYGPNYKTIANMSKKTLEFYSYLTRGKLPMDFIKVKNSGEEPCTIVFEGGNLKFTFSTPTLTIDAIVIKNESPEIITIDQLNFQYTDEMYLRTRAEDFKIKKNPMLYDGKIKLNSGHQLVIPTKICLNTMKKIKPADSVVEPTDIGRSYFYGKAFYLDSIGVNGYKFPIKQADKMQIVQAYYRNKSYSAEGSCPYIYSFDAKSEKYLLEDHIIYKKNAIPKMGYDTLKLNFPAYKMLLAEIDDETSFIDQIFILKRSPNKKPEKIMPMMTNLKSIDKNYQKLRRGDKIEILFEKFVADPKSQYSLVSYGYYTAHGRAYKAPKVISL